MKLKKKTWYYLKYTFIGILICVTGIIYWLSHDFNMHSESADDTSTFSVESADDQHQKNESSEQITLENTSQEITTNNIEQIYVYICGEVMKPGVKECKKGIRIYELIELSGGVTEQADEKQLNLADVLQDGQKVYIPAVGEKVEQMTESGELSGRENQTKVNINLASKEQLMILPGIGEAKALDIISYRTEHGSFASIEDIKKISGIKEAAYSKIKNFICV